MNRLVIIGNGFDLSHGLKTRFIDFLNYYTINFINTYINKYRGQGQGRSTEHEDGLMLFKYEPLDHIIIGRLEKIQNFNQFVNEFQESQNLILKFPLLNEFHNHSGRQKKWVDFEMLYFETLVKVYREKEDKINEYQNQFEIIKNDFIEYLKTQLNENPIGKNIPEQREFFEHFKNIFLEGYNPTIKEKILFLNFNYTNVLRKHLKYLGTNPLVSSIYIHGEIEDENNPIIFGFGDEHNTEYLVMEEEKNTKLFKYIKSINYIKTRNYLKLNSFINQRSLGQYEVVVLGHSCGLTDRTLLREIFEHDNCTSVKLYYYEDENGNNDFFDKSVEVMRHFKKKTKFRQRIVFEEKQRMVQISDFK